MGATVGRPAVDPTIEHHHLAVHPVEGAQSKVAMAQHLVDRRVAFITAGEQTGDSGDLVCFASARGQRADGKHDERQHAPNDQTYHLTDQSY